MQTVINEILVSQLMTYDAVIIGSGLSGLIVGAKLAKEGKKILILEKETSPGGYASCFTFGDYIGDSGLQILDGLYGKDSKVEIFEDLDVFSGVEFVPNLTGFYRFTNGRKDFVLPSSREKATKLLIELFPEEERGIVKFFNTISAVTKPTSTIPQLKGKTAGDLLDRFFENDDLKTALAGTIPYYGDDPYKLSAVTFALALSSRFRAGTHYIKGGSTRLTASMVNFITKHGGSLLLNRKATKIVVKRGKALGVEYVNTQRKSAKPTNVEAKFIVANASVHHVVNDLLHDKVNKKFKERINNLEIGHSMTNIYVGFEKQPSDLENRFFVIIVNDKDVVELKDIIKNHKGDYEKRNFIFADFSQINSGLAPLGKGIGVISVVDYIENWMDLSKAEYTEKKKSIADILVYRLCELIPALSGNITHTYVSTPRTKQEYTLNPKGTFLGFANTANQTGKNRLQTKSPIRNLYFASAWIYPGGGFSSTILAGWQCAKKLLKKL